MTNDFDMELKLFDQSCGHCAYCFRVIEFSEKHNFRHPSGWAVNFVTPQKHGGKYEFQNLVVACLRCDKQKADKSSIDFMKEVKK